MRGVSNGRQVDKGQMEDNAKVERKIWAFIFLI